MTPLLSARCQESSKHRLSPAVLLVQVSRNRPGAGERDLALPAQPSLPAPVHERWSDSALSLQVGAGEFSQGGFSRILETPWVSCREGVLCPPGSPGHFLSHSHGFSPPLVGIPLAKVDAPCRHHSVLTSQGMY